MKKLCKGVLCILLCICSPAIWGQGVKNDFIIKGSIESAGDIMLYLAPVDANFNMAYPGDSAHIKNGEFAFRGKTDRPRLYYLYCRNVIFQGPTWLLIEPGVTEVHIDVNNQGKFHVSGSAATIAYFNFSKEYDRAVLAHNNSFMSAALPFCKRDTVLGELRWSIKETTNCYLLKTDTIRAPGTNLQSLAGVGTEYGFIKIVLRDTMASGDIIIRRYGDSTEVHMKKTVIKHLKINNNSEIGAVIAYQHFVGGHYTDEAAIAYNMLSTRARNTPFGKSFRQYIDINTLRKKIDFSFTDINGYKIRLSDVRSKYIFIHFWAGWCSNCHRENKELAALYGKYSRDEFELINISFDSSRDEWEKGIKAGALPGIHTSELKVFDNDLARKFNIRFLPSGFLLDSNRNIILMNPDMVGYIDIKMKGK